MKNRSEACSETMEALYPRKQMGQKLRELVKKFAADPTPGNRDAFWHGLIMSSISIPKRKGVEVGTILSQGSNGEEMLFVYTDSTSALAEPGVTTAYGNEARVELERAFAKGVGLIVATGHRKKDPRAEVAKEDVPSLLKMGRQADPVLGDLVWEADHDDKDGFWRFEAGPVGGRSVVGVVVPKTTWGSIPSQSLPRIRRVVEWVRANDPAIRLHIATELWEWFSEDNDPSDRGFVANPQVFADTLTLEVLRFEHGHDPYLDYADHGLVGGYGVRIHVNSNGEFVGKPQIC